MSRPMWVGVALVVTCVGVWVCLPDRNETHATTDWYETARVRLERDLYGARRVGAAAGWQASNARHDFLVEFGDDGITIAPRGGAAWRLTLQARSLGRGELGGVAVPAVGLPAAEGTRVTYARELLSEWYWNGPAGLEQGFDVIDSPSGTGPLRLELALRGLAPRVGADGLQATLVDDAGVEALRYGGLAVWDATGAKVLARLVSASSTELAIVVEDAGAVYPLVIDPLITSPAWTSEGNQASALYGHAMGIGDINGDAFADIAVGAPNYDEVAVDGGMVRVYHGARTGLAAADSWSIKGGIAGLRMGSAVAGAGDVNGDGYADLLVGADAGVGYAYLYRGSSTGLATSPAWTGAGAQSGGFFGGTVAGAGDVNGDGFADILVGERELGNGQTDEGRVYLYHGSASGPAAMPTWQVESNQAGATLGESVAGVGDVNGDGYGDVLVGASGHDNGEADEGRAYLFHGSATGLAASAAWITESQQAGAALGDSVAGAGDVNGDGLADVVVGASGYDNGLAERGRAFVFHGTAGGLAAAAAWTADGAVATAVFGASVAGAGDVNGDGFADVVIGAPLDTNGQAQEGRAFVYHGGPSGLGVAAAAVLEADQASAGFGGMVAPAGDVDGDGLADLLVGSIYHDNGQTDEGRAFLFRGSALGVATVTPAWRAESNTATTYFGTAVAGAGDVNGDGFGDVAVGALYWTNGQSHEGSVSIYFGSATGVGSTPWIGESNAADAELGTSVSSAGDVNGDGYADVIVAAQYIDSYSGEVFVYHGSATGPVVAPRLDPNLADASFGHPLSSAGDVNGDGYGDVVVGARTVSNGQNGEGRAYVFHGSSTGLRATAGWQAEGNLASVAFGGAVSSAGDVNGDGFSDVVIAANFYVNGENDEGRAYVFHGSATGLASTPAWTVEGNQNGAQLGSGVAGVGDVNRDGFGDVAIGVPFWTNGQQDEGAMRLFHGSATGLASAPAWAWESNQARCEAGQAVAAAGDVNGDGYADVAVAARLYDNGESNEGSVFVFHGTATGLSATPAGTMESNQSGSELGFAVGGAGDVNGDGYADVIVGADAFANGQSGEGAAFLYHGSGGEARAGSSAAQRTPSGTRLLSQGEHAAGSVILHVAGRSTVGRSRAKLQWELKPSSTPFDGAGLSTSASFVDTTTALVQYSGTAAPSVSGAYHWRARLLYDPTRTIGGQVASRWFAPHWSKPSGADFRVTASAPPAIGSALVTGSVAEGSASGTFNIQITGTDPEGETLTYRVDCDGDGVYGEAGEPVESHAPGTYTLTCTGVSATTWNGPTSRSIGIQLTDIGQTTTSTSYTVSVTNVAPTVAPTNGGPVSEGSGTVLVTPNGSDPYDMLAYDYDCDDDGIYEVTAQAGAHSCPYGPRNNGTFVVGVRANDGTTTGTGTTTVTVDNTAPTVAPTSGGPVSEGSGTVLVTPNGSDPYDTLTYDYDCDNNGTYEVTAQAGAYSCAYGPRNDGTLTIAVRAVDGTTSTQASTAVTVVNLPPALAPTNGGPVGEGSGTVLVTPNGSDAFDTLTYDYDCNNDGTFEISAQPGAHACPYSGQAQGTFVVAVRANDNLTSSTATTTVTVSNGVPTLAPTNDGPVDEGSGFVLVSPNGFDAVDTLTYDYDCDDDGTFEVMGEAGAFLCPYTHDDGTFTVVVRADDATTTATAATTVTVENIAPSVVPTNAGPVSEGSGTVLVTPNGSDPYDMLAYDYDCDDDGIYEIVAQPGAHDCAYGPRNAGTLVVAVRASDGVAAGTGTTTIIVDNVAPSIDSLESSGPVGEGTTVTLTAVASDPHDSLLYDADCDGDGNYAGGTDLVGQPDGVLSCAVGDDGTQTINVRVRDDVTATSSSIGVTVLNLSPVVAPTLGAGPYSVLDVLTCAAGYSDVAQDPVASLTYDWRVNGMLLGRDQATLTSVHFLGGDTVSCTVVATDGDGGSSGNVESASVSIDPDCDDDGLTDTWEATELGGDARTCSLPSGPSDDSDGDGRTNLEEQAAGTDPQLSDAPGAPTILSPQDGAAVGSTTPTLAVTNAVDAPPADTLTYDFEMYSNETLGTLVSSATGVAEGTSSTAWLVPVTLTLGAQYWWRARANDGHVAGPWSAVASFTVGSVDTPPLIASVAAQGSLAEGSAGASFAVLIDVTDAEGALLTIQIDCDDDGFYSEAGEPDETSLPGTLLLDCTDVDVSLMNGPGNRSFTVRADDGTSVVTHSSTVSVDNVLPGLALSNAGPVLETATTVQLTAVATDPFDAVVIDYDCDNDGIYELTNAGPTAACPLPAGLDDGTFTLAARVSDDVGTTTGTTVLTVGNVAPVLTPVVSGVPLTVLGTLTCSPGYVDVPGDTPPASLVYAWQVNGASLPLDQPTLASPHFGGGDRVRCAVTASDGDGGLAGPVLSSEVTIGWDPLESTCRHASLSIL